MVGAMLQGMVQQICELTRLFDGVDMNQIDYYQAKLDFEIDCAELFAALNADRNKIVVVDARSAVAYGIEHIPAAINWPI